MAVKKAVRTNSQDLMFGQAGSTFTNTNTQVVAPTGKCFCAIQFIADTTFDELTPQQGFTNTNGICVGGAGNQKGLGLGSLTEKMGTGGQIINVGSASNLTKFPKGMIIYGRWESFTIDADADGGVIAYVSQ